MNEKTPDRSPPDEGPRRPGFDATMRIELGQIVEDPIFQNSPTLVKLLRYLVEETLAGRGDRLKAYGIAVDVLGRPSDFNAQSDSYPRVQVGRLRRALASFYAQHPPLGDLCLYLHQGSYRVRMGQLAKAYPKLFRPLSCASTEEEPLAVRDDAALDRVTTGPSRKLRLLSLPHDPPLKWIAGAIVLVATAATLSLWHAGTGNNRVITENVGYSPVILLSPVVARSDPETAELGRNAFALIADGLSRSWVARVRADSTLRDKGQPPAAASSYRLDTQLDRSTNGHNMLFVRLIDEKSGTMIWSTSLLVRAQTMADDLAPLMSQISGPDGAVASEQARHLADNYDRGYPCLVHFLSFLASRDPGLKYRIGICLALPVGDGRLEATRLAFLSTFAVSLGNLGLDRSSAVRLSRNYARDAIDADVNEAYAHFAMSRTSFIAGDCATGLRHAQLATAANPYDTLILAVLGGLSSQCGQAEGFGMLDRAYRFYVPGESFARLPLILAQIQQRRFDRLSKLSDLRQPKTGPGVAYYFLCETMISAALDQPRNAALNWSGFVAAARARGQSNEEMLYAVIASDEVRTRVLHFLQTKGVISDKVPPRVSTSGGRGI